MSIKEKIELINPGGKLSEWRKTSKIVLQPDEKILLEDVYKQLHPNTYKMDMGCASCVIHYLQMIEAYYSRL